MFSIIFKDLSVTRNCLRPDSVPLNSACKIEQSHFTGGMPFLPSNLEQISPNTAKINSLIFFARYSVKTIVIANEN